MYRIYYCVASCNCCQQLSNRPKKKLRWIPSIQPLFWSFGIYHFLIHFIFFSQGSIKLHSQAWAALSTGALASSTSTTTWARRTPPSCLGETFAMEPGTHLENMAMGLQIFILQFDLHCPVGWANPWLFTWQRLPRHLRLPWHGGRSPAKMIFFLCPGGFQREGPSLGGSLVDWISGHCGAPSSLLLPAHLLSGGFLKILSNFLDHVFISAVAQDRLRCQQRKQRNRGGKQLPQNRFSQNAFSKELKGESSENKRDAFFPALKRLLSNKLFMANFGSTIFFVFAFMGFGTFMPKYILTF